MLGKYNSGMNGGRKALYFYFGFVCQALHLLKILWFLWSLNPDAKFTVPILKSQWNCVGKYNSRVDWGREVLNFCFGFVCEALYLVKFLWNHSDQLKNSLAPDICRSFIVYVVGFNCFGLLFLISSRSKILQI